MIDNLPARIGPYRILRLLGQGGMGVVYLAETDDGHRVAVKVIRGERVGDPGSRRRFLREIEILRRITDAAPACTIGIRDAKVTQDLAYLVTDYVDGPDLAAAFRASGPLPHDDLIGLGIGMTAALQTLHGAGVIHRDLKPGNVILGPDGPKVIDFGISQVVSGTLGTVTHTAIGTAAYMSPEQAQGLPLTPATDIFSWGAVMAFAATGRSPFGDGSRPDVLYRVVYGEPDLEGIGDPNLHRLIMRALDKNAERRPDARRLHAALTGAPVDDAAPADDMQTWTVPDPHGPHAEPPPRADGASPTMSTTPIAPIAQRTAGLAVTGSGAYGMLTATGTLKVVAALAAAVALVPLAAPLPWSRRRRRWIAACAAVLGLLLPLNVVTGLVPLGVRACEEADETRARPVSVTGFDTTGQSQVVGDAAGVYRIRANGGYTWTGIAGALPNWCSFQIDLDVRVVGPTQNPYEGMGWGYGLGACSRFNGSQPRGLSLQYAFYQDRENQQNHLAMTQLPEANAFPGTQPPSPPNGLDYAPHHWRMVFDHGRISYQFDYGVVQTPWYAAAGHYPLLADCVDSQFLLRAWLAEIEVRNISISPG